ncbi:MAG: hypothetical protein M3546_02650 [Actinomycetota bacterium]|nr:hypothetical protein [Actinomycetota bacterium]
MRELADAERICRFMRELGSAADTDGTCYLAGGATAVLLGWRETTIDVDIELAPDTEALLRALPRLKNELRINVEMASPSSFIPLPAGWEDRSPFVGREGRLSFYHFDLYCQALSKLERAHRQDLEDVRSMLERQLVEPARVLAYFDEIAPELYRFPAIDPPAFRRRVDVFLDIG